MSTKNTVASRVLGVMSAGMLFALSGVRPVPAIVAAQAANGILLPLVAAFLLVAVRDGERIGGLATGRVGGTAVAAVVGVTVFLGLLALARTAATLTAQSFDLAAVLPWLAGAGALVTVWMGWIVLSGRGGRRT